MLQPKMDLYFYELAWWKRVVIYLEDEILQMNKRLSRMVISSASTSDLLSKFEVFQESFFSNNELLRLFINECQILEEKIFSCENADSVELNQLEMSMNKLSREISHFENVFIGLRNDFLLFNKTFADINPDRQ